MPYHEYCQITINGEKTWLIFISILWFKTPISENVRLYGTARLVLLTIITIPIPQKGHWSRIPESLIRNVY